MSEFKIGMVGLDTSHVTAFAKRLHDSGDPDYVAGAKIAVAYPGGSPDFDLSINRVSGFTKEMHEIYGVEIVDTIAALKGKCNVIFLTAVDGRVHLDHFRQVADWGLPVFIDKPLTTASAEAREIAYLAKEKGVRVMTASAIRYGQELTNALSDNTLGPIQGADIYGPITLIQALPGFFWYGVHSAEGLYAALGKGCEEVHAFRSGDHDIIVGRWKDGRLGTIRGARTDNYEYGGIIHRQRGSQSVDFTKNRKPYDASMLVEVIRFLKGEDVLDFEESVEVIRFLEAANESVASGKLVKL